MCLSENIKNFRLKKDLTQEQKETLANKIWLTLLRHRWGHVATFWAVDKDGNRLPY